MVMQLQGGFRKKSLRMENEKKASQARVKKTDVYKSDFLISLKILSMVFFCVKKTFSSSHQLVQTPWKLFILVNEPLFIMSWNVWLRNYFLFKV